LKRTDRHSTAKRRPAVEVQFDLTLEDIQGYQTYVLDQKKGHGRRKGARLFRPGSPLVWVAVIVALLGPGIVVMATENAWPTFNFKKAKPNDYLALALPLVVGLSFLWGWWAQGKAQRRAPKKLFEDLKSRNMVDDIVVSITPGQFLYSNRVTSTALDWSLIGKIDCTDEYLFIIQGKEAGYVIPRRAFSSDSEFTTFYETARRFKKG
jgi:hypothetical protein